MALYHNHCREGNSARKQFSFQHRFFGTLIIASSFMYLHVCIHGTLDTNVIILLK